MKILGERSSFEVVRVETTVRTIEISEEDVKQLLLKEAIRVLNLENDDSQIKPGWIKIELYPPDCENDTENYALELTYKV